MPITALLVASPACTDQHCNLVSSGHSGTQILGFKLSVNSFGFYPTAFINLQLMGDKTDNFN
jgi:hypothetical protein